jgi:hypothetical protein
MKLSSQTHSVAALLGRNDGRTVLPVWNQILVLRKSRSADWLNADI